MKYENIFKINKNTEYIENDDVLKLMNKNCAIEPNIKIKFVKNLCIDLIIGFSMNINHLTIKLNENEVELNEISKITLYVNFGDKIEIIPNKITKYYEIYLNIKNMNANKTNISKIESINSNIIQKNSINQILQTNSWLNNIKKIIIITTKIISSISEYFKIIFEHNGYLCEIKYELEIKQCMEMAFCPDTIFIILFYNSSHYLLPTKFIFYQIEQIDSIFLTDEKFKSKLKYLCIKSVQVWEYTNITGYIYSKYCKNKLKCIPMPFVLDKNILKFETSEIDLNEFDYDIFFYGTKNLRREKILNELTKYFKIKVGWNTYGNTKIKYIKKSKIILNLHYYVDAGLETCRFNEILNYNKIIISEKSHNDLINMELYENLIVMVEPNNVDELINCIKFYLNPNNYLNKINENKILIKKLEQKIIDKIIPNTKNV